MKPSIAAALFFFFLGAPAWGQSQTDISQKTGGVCSPAVVSQGKVTITCIGLDSRQQATLRKIPGLLDLLLKRRQSDQTEIMAKLEEILKHEERTTQAVANLEQKTALIKAIDAVVSVKLVADWKDGHVPESNKMIFPGGAPKGLEVTFELTNGDYKIVEFYGTQGLRIYSPDDKVTVFEYHSAATPDNNIFGMNPKNILAIRKVGFATYGLHSGAVVSPEVKFKQLNIKFFVNGIPSLDYNADVNEKVDMSRKDKSVEEIWIWQGQGNLQLHKD